MAVRNYITESRNQLSFHKGDIIRLQRMDGLESGESHMADRLRTFTVISWLSASVSLCV